MSGRRARAIQLASFLAAFFLVWTLRATVFYRVDESIASPVSRAAYSGLLKLLLWVLPAAVFARVFRRTPASRYLGMSAWPSRRDWLACLAVTAAFLLVVALAEATAGGKSFSVAGLTALPLGLWILQVALTPLLEEVLFRGMILRELLALLPKYRAIALNALLFAGVHAPYWLSHRGATLAVLQDLGGVFAFSVVACWAFARTKSIWPPTVAHIANNLLAAMLIAGRA
jgi:membrane protease YdiL (CAAX protease family)